MKSMFTFITTDPECSTRLRHGLQKFVLSTGFDLVHLQKRHFESGNLNKLQGLGIKSWEEFCKLKEKYYNQLF